MRADTCSLSSSPIDFQTRGLRPTLESGGSSSVNSLLDIGSVIEKVLIEHGIVLHVGERMKKYVSN
jgi:hypothetical protein